MNRKINWIFILGHYLIDKLLEAMQLKMLTCVSCSLTDRLTKIAYTIVNNRFLGSVALEMWLNLCFSIIVMQSFAQKLWKNILHGFVK